MDEEAKKGELVNLKASRVMGKVRATVTSKQNIGSLASSAAVLALMLLPRSALRFGTSSSAHANSCA